MHKMIILCDSIVDNYRTVKGKFNGIPFVIYQDVMMNMIDDVEGFLSKEQKEDLIDHFLHNICENVLIYQNIPKDKKGIAIKNYLTKFRENL